MLLCFSGQMHPDGFANKYQQRQHKGDGEKPVNPSHGACRLAYPAPAILLKMVIRW